MSVVDWVVPPFRLITKSDPSRETGDFHVFMRPPTVLEGVSPEMRISCDEVFGPVVGITRVDDIDQAIALANDTNYGLSAAIFTENVNWAMQYVRQVESGNIHVNWGTQWRADLMPYGGLKDSGMGKEGPKYAVEEMTETKMCVFHL
jgi:glyceraldehyde-3-phosphate dehydrogenase (NADP+)